MPVYNFSEFKLEYDAALLSMEDRVIEVEASFDFEEELARINHGYRLTVVSVGGKWMLGTPSIWVGNFDHFVVSSGMLILDSVILTADVSDDATMSPGGVEVGNHGSLVMENATIQNVENSVTSTIWILRNGRVQMNDSTIKNCSGSVAGAVWVEEGGSFTMDYASLIQDCVGFNTSHGNQVLVNGQFQMNNGLITNSGDLIYNGVTISEEGVFRMTGGTISGCLAGVSLETGSTFYFDGGVIAANKLGILSDVEGIRKVVRISGGEIHSNRIGLAINEGTDAVMTGGKIYDHGGADGAGVVVVYGSRGNFTMSGGEIFNNVQGICIQQTGFSILIKDQAEIYGNGYGVLIDHSTVTVEGGKIYGSRMPESRYPYGGLGIFVGFHGRLYLSGSEIYDNEYYGIWAQYSATVYMNEGQVFDNGLCGIHLDNSVLHMEGGSVFDNGGCGVSLDSVRMDEPKGSLMDMTGGVIRDNDVDGINVMGIAICEVYEGEIRDNKRMGIRCQHRSETICYGGNIHGNYYGVALSGMSDRVKNVRATVIGGRIFGNVIGVMVGEQSDFRLEGGEIFNNSGLLDSMRSLPNAVNGGIGIAVNFGNAVMDGGKIYGHVGFPSWQCYAVGNDLLGAAVCIMVNGSFEMVSGEIVDNRAPVGAAIYVPNQVYTPIVVRRAAYFNRNSSSEGQFPHNYIGGIRHVDANVFFAHTSVGCHILNNFDVNYSAGSVIAMKYWDYFPDLNFARVIYEQLDRDWEAYIAQCEFAPIVSLEANRRCIRSIEGAQYLFNLEYIYLNDNFIIDISPLGWYRGKIGEGVKFEAHRQWRKLEDIYVSRYRELPIFGQAVTPVPDPEVDPEFDLEDVEEVVDEDDIDAQFFGEEGLAHPAVKTRLPAVVYKYNGRYDKDKLGQELVWWEAGRCAIRWGVDGFDGYVFQRAVPIPIDVLFPNLELARRMARILNKNEEAPIDITELFRLAYVDLSVGDDEAELGGGYLTQPSDLEGLQFLPGLKVLNLRRTGMMMADVVEFFAANAAFDWGEVRFLVDS